jgi:DNA-binding beta-propeller fold protein YncE
MDSAPLRSLPGGRLLACLLLGVLFPAVSEASTTRIEREGIAIDVTIENLRDGRAAGELREGDEVRVRLDIADTLTDTPITSLYPAGWLDRLPKIDGEEPETCKKKVETFVGGGVLAAAELDLNVYYVLAMNDEASISVVDPLFGFGGSKLLTTIPLSSPAEDWEVTRQDERVFASLPRSQKVAVIDTDTFTLNREIPIEGLPTRMRLSADERHLWVTYEAQGSAPSGVAVIDTRELAEVARVETGPGRHEVVLSADGRRAFVSNSGTPEGVEGSVTVLDVDRLLAGEGEKAVVSRLRAGRHPVSMAYSSIADAVFVSDSVGGEVVVVDGRSAEISARMEAEPGLGQIRFAPGDRYGFVVNPVASLVHIIDAATRRIVQTGETEEAPNQVTFSDELAYLRHRGSDIVLMIPLGQVGQPGAPVPVIDFPGGHSPSGQSTMPSSAETLVQAPGANAVLVANAMDKMIYYYKEGMAAPMGEFKTYGRQPRAVEVVDKSLREVAPGSYETTVRLRRPGDYELALFVDSPRVIECLPLTVKGDEKTRLEGKPAVQAALELDDNQLTLGETLSLRVRLSDRLSGEAREGVPGVRVMAMLVPGTWHDYLTAEEAGDGLYTVDFVPPEAGLYYLFPEALAEGVTTNQSLSVVVQVTPKTQDGAQP